MPNSKTLWRPKIMVFAVGYLPGFKWGGPVLSVANLVEKLHGEFDFWIVTSDRDLGDRKAYSGIQQNVWCRTNTAHIMYMSPGLTAWFRVMGVLYQNKYDIIYLNSFFGRQYSMAVIFYLAVSRWAIALLKATTGRVASLRVNVLLAPRGEFSAGALNLKRRRKAIYIFLAKVANLYKYVYWHASADEERSDIIKNFPQLGRLRVAPPLTATSVLVASDLVAPKGVRGADVLLGSNTKRRKDVGCLKLVFVSRITPKKNLDFALEVLAKVRGRVEFSIAGPIEDRNYWGKCERLIQEMPKNISVLFRGPLAHHAVQELFLESHLFFFPTRGENFGHVIIEAMCNGCPVLISDQTPWRRVGEEGVGWDIRLENKSEFADVIERFIEMDHDEFDRLSTKVGRFGVSAANQPQIVEMNRSMFEVLLTDRLIGVFNRLS